MVKLRMHRPHGQLLQRSLDLLDEELPDLAARLLEDIGWHPERYIGPDFRLRPFAELLLRQLAVDAGAPGLTAGLRRTRVCDTVQLAGFQWGENDGCADNRSTAG